MRVGLLSDIHGNRTALAAVLADAQTWEVDAYLVLGDIVALGPDPVGVLELLHALPSVRFVRGNTDRYVLTGDVPPPYPDEVLRDPALLGRVIEIARNFTWTQGCVAGAGWLDWLAGLPLEHRVELPDGRRLLAVHASPGKDDGAGLAATLSDDDLDFALDGVDADIVCVGHTHHAFARRSTNGVLVVNPGSISNPIPPDLRASYAIIDGETVTHRRVDYDHDAVIDEIRRVRHPAAEFLVGLQQGRHP